MYGHKKLLKFKLKATNSDKIKVGAQLFLI